MTARILVCTVGGSPQPVVTAISTIRPDRIIFICSEDDPATGRSGSYEMVEGVGADKISHRCKLMSQDFGILKVPADEVGPAFHQITTVLDRLNREDPECIISADPTGGTKSMTAALMLAAIDRPNVQLQLVTGARDNLQRVSDGSEYVVTQDVEAVRLHRRLKPLREVWQRFAYDDAAEGADALLQVAPPSLRPGVQRFRDLSRGFAAWDRFDHKEARTILGRYTAVAGDWLKVWLPALTILAHEDATKREPLILIDLWRNAERRAAQGRYDDAVGRCYRMIEWTAQWLWRARHKVSTDDFPSDYVPQKMNGDIRANSKGKFEIGLWRSWEILATREPDTAAAGFFSSEQNTMKNHLQIRNFSLLAHGFEPVGKQRWNDLAVWIETLFVPMLKQEMKAMKCRPDDLPQLPNAGPPDD